MENISSQWLDFFTSIASGANLDKLFFYSKRIFLVLSLTISYCMDFFSCVTKLIVINWKSKFGRIDQWRSQKFALGVQIHFLPKILSKFSFCMQSLKSQFYLLLSSWNLGVQMPHCTPLWLFGLIPDHFVESFLEN